MPGIAGCDIVALDYIRKFPKEEQAVAREIYFVLNTIPLLNLTKFLLAPLIAAAAGVCLTFALFETPNTFSVVVIPYVMGFCSYRLIGVMWIDRVIIARKVNRVKSILLRDHEARLAFARLKDLKTIMGPNFRKISEKYSV
jgi:hypothetical protein